MPRTASVLTEEFTAALNKKFADVPGSYGSTFHYDFTIVVGNKFDKIMVSHRLNDSESDHHSVHAFVERSTGALVKAAGLNAPARGVNGLLSNFNLSTHAGMNAAVSAADQYGGYLYQR